MKNIRYRAGATLAACVAFAFAVLIGHGGARAAVDDRDDVAAQSPGEVWEWDVTSTKWDHDLNCWTRKPQDVPDARLANPGFDQPDLD